GILNRLPHGATWFETSTNDLRAWRAVARAAPAHLTLCDAPVTGGAEGAQAGTLTMLLGGDARALDHHRELLGAIAAQTVHMGRCGAGYVAKLCQLHLNYLAAHGIGEALMLGAKADLDLTALHRVLMASCAQSYVVDHYIPKVLDGSYDRSFALGLAARDMRLVSELGAHLRVDLNLADAVCADYARACAAYGADAPHLSNIRLIEERSRRLLRDDSQQQQPTQQHEQQHEQQHAQQHAQQSERDG
ncbi:MAG: NAD(P)-dependent oxidoreductase, partial [bacterium]